MIREKCSCGASLKLIGGVPSTNREMLLDWRANHHHEMSAEQPEPPLIHESNSHHERADPNWFEENGRPIGFRAND